MKQRFVTYLRRTSDTAAAAGRRFAADHLSAYAAQATFYLLLSFFPFVMLTCMASRLLPFLKEETLQKVAILMLPPDYHSLGTGLIDSYYNENIGSTKFVLILFLIWTASRLIQALMNGFNSAYGIEETRSQTVLRLIGCVYTVALCGLMVTLIVMYALGTHLVGLILARLPDFVLLELIVKLARNLATPVLLFLIFWLSYVILPSRHCRFREELPGALLTAASWHAAAALYGIFLSKSLAQYSYVYGSLAGLVMLLIWLYTCMYLWFLGAELNYYLRRRREEGLSRQPSKITRTSRPVGISVKWPPALRNRRRPASDCGCEKTSLTAPLSAISPPSMMDTCEQICRMTSISWVMTTMVMPSRRLISCKRARMERVVMGSSAEVASSHRSTLGSMASARAMATRCFCPPDSCAG